MLISHFDFTELLRCGRLEEKDVERGTARRPSLKGRERDIVSHLPWKEERGTSSVIFLDRTREGHRQSSSLTGRERDIVSHLPWKDERGTSSVIFLDRTREGHRHAVIFLERTREGRRQSSSLTGRERDIVNLPWKDERGTSSIFLERMREGHRQSSSLTGRERDIVMQSSSLKGRERDVVSHLPWQDERGTSSIFLERMREGPSSIRRTSEGCFEFNVGESSERRGGEANMFFFRAHRYHLELTDLNWTEMHPGDRSYRMAKTESARES